MSTVDLTGLRWRKSSFSGGTGGGNDNCVEIAMRWRKSSFSGGEGGGNDSCVEIALADSALVRDSKNADGPVLVLSVTAWSALLASTRH